MPVLGVIADYRAKEDVLEILGFLTSEWVQTLTEGALALKKQEFQNARCEVARVVTGVKRKLGSEGPFVMRDNRVGREREEREAREAMARIRSSRGMSGRLLRYCRRRQRSTRPCTTGGS
jgi:hypothetical protein